MPFPNSFYPYLQETTLVGIKGGSTRKSFLDIWMVAVGDRVFARSWNKSERSWFTAFRETGIGEIRYGERVLQVKGTVLESGDDLHPLINSAYLQKYTQAKNLPYAHGITQAEYTSYTLEFLLDGEAPIDLPLTYTLETDRLRLSIPTEADFPHIFSATRYAGFNDGMLWEPPTDLSELVKPLHNNTRAWQQGTAFGFTIHRKDTDEFLGRISIRKLETSGTWDIGFWTHPQHQGQGIMTEAARAVLDFGFTRIRASRIEAAHAVWNKASEKVLHRIGMTFDHHVEQGFQKKGEWVAENELGIEYAAWVGNP